MLISFVQSQLMTFTQSLGIILGANIGATVTAQLVAFKFTDAALAMVAVGFLMHLLGKTQKVRSIGDIILGFGILFFGMKLMTEATNPLRTYPAFLELMKNLEQPLLGMLVGLFFTALIQSSGASIGIVIVLAQQDLITLEAAIPVMLGANIGTCVTAVLASIGTSKEAKRVTLAYIIIETIGVGVFLLFIPQFADFVRLLTSQIASGTAREIANAHTIFNVVVAMAFLPAIGLVAALCNRLLPDSKTEQGVIPVTWHIDPSMLATPPLAMELARAEIARMTKIVYRMHRAAIYPFVSNKPRQDSIYPQLSLLEGIDMREKKVDFLEKHIREYLLQINRSQLTHHQAAEILTLIALLDALEGIADAVVDLIVPLIEKKLHVSDDFSSEGKRELVIYHRKVSSQLRLLEEAMTTLAYSLANEVIIRRKEYGELDNKFRQSHLNRVFDLREECVATHCIHIELMDALKIINLHTAEIANLLLKSGMLSRQDLDDGTGESDKDELTDILNLEQGQG